MPPSDGRPVKQPLLPVAEALARITAPLTAGSSETIQLNEAIGRVLANDLISQLDLPPEPVSSMDGYGVRSSDCVAIGTKLTRIGESAAGHPFVKSVNSGETVRIFTGAIVPPDVDSIILQEDVDAEAEADGAVITINEPASKGKFIRPAGLDTTKGAIVAEAGTKINARVMAIALATGHTSVDVHKKPRIGILSTGDELVLPGETPALGQVISSNAAYLTAFVTACGGEPVDLGIAADRPGALLEAVRATTMQLDMIVTTGGASVGVHDHIAGDLAQNIDFWKIAMRPGKPLISGAVDDIPLIGLPGNPVSSAVCALVFLRPAIAKLSGRDIVPEPIQGVLDCDLPANDQREDYLRVRLTYRDNDVPLISPAPKQDSSMISVLANADALAIRPPFDPARTAGDPLSLLLFPDGL